MASDPLYRNWFWKFRSVNFDLEDAPRSGRPIKADDSKIKTLVDADRHVTTREIVEKLKLSNSTVYDHLKCLGFVSKLDTWVTHKLKKIDLIPRVTICDLLLKGKENDLFLKRIITGDVNKIIYNNVRRKRLWCRREEPAQSTTKADIAWKKVILSVWWDWKGTIFFELLPNNPNINLDVYCRQLDELDAATNQKRPKLVNREHVVLHHKMPDQTQIWSLARNFCSLDGTFYRTHHTLLTWHHRITIFSGIFKIL